MAGPEPWERQTDRERETDRQRDRERQTERQRQTHRDTETQTDRDRHTERQRKTHRETETVTTPHAPVSALNCERELQPCLEACAVESWHSCKKSQFQSQCHWSQCQ